MAVRAMRAAAPKIEIGIVLNVGPGIPATDSDADREAVRRHDMTTSRLTTSTDFSSRSEGP